MSHIGLICPPTIGHLEPMASLGRELQRRGHRVTMFGVPDVEPFARSSALEYRPIGAGDFPRGAIERLTHDLGALAGTRANLRWHRNDRALAEMMCRDGIAAIGRAGVDALLVDQMDAAGPSVAEALGVPFVTVCVGLPSRRERGMPPIYTAWPESRSWAARARADLAFAAARSALRPIHRGVDAHRRRWGLAPRGDHAGYFQESRLAIIAQLCPALDFQRDELPPWFHYVGLLRSADIGAVSPRHAPAASAFPFARLTGAALVYATFGTMVQAKPRAFRAIAAACAELGAQLVVSLGGDASLRASIGHLPGDAIVADYAPQLELLARAKLTVTHGGLNTVLESLAFGVPIVAMPFAFDQPGVGARLEQSGAGIVAHPWGGAAGLRSAVRRALGDPGVRGNARRLQIALLRCGGVERAATIAESAFGTRMPVLRDARATTRGALRLAH